MRRTVGLKLGLGVFLALAGLTWSVTGILSCGSAPTPFIIQTPSGIGNETPTLVFEQPNADITLGQGNPFLIEWRDTDRDDNAIISFSLEATDSPIVVLLAGDIKEDSDDDSFTVLTTNTISPGTYNLLGTIADSVNPPVEPLYNPCLTWALPRGMFWTSRANRPRSRPTRAAPTTRTAT